MEGWILESAKPAFKLPEMITSFANVATSATASVFPRVTAPPTFTTLLNDASPSTNSLSFVVISSYTNNRLFMETSVANVFAGNAPSTILEDGILESAKFAFKLPAIVTSFANVAASETASVFPRVTAPPTFTTLLNDASFSTFSLFLVVICPATNNCWSRETLAENVFAGNTPPTIAADGMLEFAKLLNAKLPDTLISFTVNAFPIVTFPPTRSDWLKDASFSTFSLFLVVICPATNNCCPRETFVSNAFPGKAPPIIAVDGMLAFAKLFNAKLPVIAISFTVNRLFIVALPPIIIFLFNEISSFMTTFLLNSAILATNSRLFAIRSSS